MRRIISALFAASLFALPLQAKVVVFWQPGFPTVASQPIDRATLEQALQGLDPVFADETALANADTFADSDLLVLPYGSAVPVDSWKAIEHYLNAGGNLLILGGQPLRVPVSLVNSQYVPAVPQDTYSRALGFRHTYEVPVSRDTAFHWRAGYAWLPSLQIHAQRFFAVEGRLNGLGYMADSAGQLVAAPFIVADHAGRGPDNRMAQLVFPSKRCSPSSAPASRLCSLLICAFPASKGPAQRSMAKSNCSFCLKRASSPKPRFRLTASPSKIWTCRFTSRLRLASTRSMPFSRKVAIPRSSTKMDSLSPTETR
jgi:hypothetical protein